MKDIIKNMSHSVRARLQNKARETEIPFDENTVREHLSGKQVIGIYPIR